MNMFDKDFTPTGVKIEGSYENDRNAASSELLKAMLREAYNVSDVIIAHHLVFVTVDHRPDDKGVFFDYQVVEEIPAIDTLIFDHEIAAKIWGENFKDVLMQLACEPCTTRDKLLANLYYGRAKN